MPRQNRVDPFGNLIVTDARGTLMGNRGCLHDEFERLNGRAWTTKAWIACLLDFKGRHRPVMPPGRWTALFFLDEATALAAGHRPCGECRRADYLRFKEAWIQGNPELDLTMAVPAQKIDSILHAERVAEAPLPTKIYFEADIDKLPDGVFYAGAEPLEAWMVWGDNVLRWSPRGYDRVEPRPEAQSVQVLTPASIVGALSAGYRPQVHASAWALSDHAYPPLP